MNYNEIIQVIKRWKEETTKDKAECLKNKKYTLLIIWKVKE